MRQKFLLLSGKRESHLHAKIMNVWCLGKARLLTKNNNGFSVTLYWNGTYRNNHTVDRGSSSKKLFILVEESWHLGDGDWMDLALTVDDSLELGAGSWDWSRGEESMWWTRRGRVWNFSTSKCKVDGRTTKWRITRKRAYLIVLEFIPKHYAYIIISLFWNSPLGNRLFIHALVIYHQNLLPSFAS